MKKRAAPPVSIEPGVYWKFRSTTFRWHWPAEWNWFEFRFFTKLALAAIALGVLSLWWGGMREVTVGDFVRAWRESHRPSRDLGVGLMFGSIGVILQLGTLVSLILDIQGPPNQPRRRRRRNMRG